MRRKAGGNGWVLTYGPQTEGQENRMKRILIIEDDTDINNMTAEFLREKGCIAEQAFSGTEGRLLWQMKEFDLLLLDLMLPGLPGGELLRQIRDVYKRQVLSLFLTGMRGKCVPMHCGMQVCLRNPVPSGWHLSLIHISSR